LTELLVIDKIRVTGSEIEGAEQITISEESIEEVASCPECGRLSLAIHVACHGRLWLVFTAKTEEPEFKAN
jgi:hypothetical protein